MVTFTLFENRNEAVRKQLHYLDNHLSYVSWEAWDKKEEGDSHCVRCVRY